MVVVLWLVMNYTLVVMRVIIVTPTLLLLFIMIIFIIMIKMINTIIAFFTENENK